MIRLSFSKISFQRISAGFGHALLFFILAAAFLPIGCGKKSKTEAGADANAKAPLSTPKAPAADAVKPAPVSFSEMLQKASTDEDSFKNICQLLLARSVLLPLDHVPEVTDAGTQPKKISIKILKEKDKDGQGTALIFSGKEALTKAGDKLAWTKNDKGVYDFAGMNGRAVFRVLQGNGYHKVVLDVASENPLVFDDRRLKDLAEGKIPAFSAKK